MTKSAVLIVNTKSREGGEKFPQARDELQKHGIQLVRTYGLRDPREVPDVVAREIAAQVPLIIVGGGDGTLSCAAGHFVGTQSVMGVLPLGTGNEFARDLTLPVDVCSACDVIANGQVTDIDLGIVNGKYFINVATIGLTTLIAQDLTHDAKKRWGKFVYVFALAHALMRIRPFYVTLQTLEETRTFKTIQVVIGNGRFHAGPFPLAPEATITDGKLVVYALEGASRWTLFKFALNLPGGHHVELTEVPAVSTIGGHIETMPRERVTVDGEIILRTPLTFEIRPRALQVMTPKGFY